MSAGDLIDISAFHSPDSDIYRCGDMSYSFLSSASENSPAATGNWHWGSHPALGSKSHC